jgi:hypothetical protein
VPHDSVREPPQAVVADPPHDVCAVLAEPRRSVGIPVTDVFAEPRCAPRELGPREGIDPAYNWADGLSED